MDANSDVNIINMIKSTAGTGQTVDVVLDGNARLVAAGVRGTPNIYVIERRADMNMMHVMPHEIGEPTFRMLLSVVAAMNEQKAFSDTSSLASMFSAVGSQISHIVKT
jgi:hypothetical protein